MLEGSLVLSLITARELVSSLNALREARRVARQDVLQVILLSGGVKMDKSSRPKVAFVAAGVSVYRMT